MQTIWRAIYIVIYLQFGVSHRFLTECILEPNQNQVLFSSCVLTCLLLIHKSSSTINWWNLSPRHLQTLCFSDSSWAVIVPCFMVLCCISCIYECLCRVLWWYAPFYYIFCSAFCFAFAVFLRGIHICGSCNTEWAVVGVCIASLHICNC